MAHIECNKAVRALSLTLSVAAVDVSLLALAVVAVAVGPLDDAGRAAGLVAVAVAARRRRLLDEVHGHEGRHQQEHARGLHLAWILDLADFTLLGASGGWMLFLLTLNVQLMLFLSLFHVGRLTLWFWRKSPPKDFLYSEQISCRLLHPASLALVSGVRALVVLVGASSAGGVDKCSVAAGKAASA